MKHRLAIRSSLAALACGALSLTLAQAQQTGSTVYRCPGNPVLYTDQLTPAQAHEKGCRTIEGAPVTVMQSARGRPVPPAASAARAEGGKVEPADQRRRDDERRSILESELRRDEDKLAELKKEYNNGEPERQGIEKNYQKYLDRVADMKASITRTESDIAAIRRELGKLQ